MTVFAKTEIAIEEIKGNTRTLNARYRQVLVMIDGKRTQDSLQNFFVHYDVPAILTKLEQSQFVETVEQQSQRINQLKAANNLSYSKSFSQRIFLEPKVLWPIQHLMADNTKQHLGILGKSLITKIHTIEDYDALMSFMSQWHMAMRESKTGRYEVKELMLQISSMI